MWFLCEMYGEHFLSPPPARKKINEEFHYLGHAISMPDSIRMSNVFEWYFRYSETIGNLEKKSLSILRDEILSIKFPAKPFPHDI